MPIRLTTQVLRECAAAPAPARTRELRDAQQPGLILRLQPSGAMRFVVQLGRGRRRTLGDAHPVHGELRLREARALAAQLLGALRASRHQRRLHRAGVDGIAPEARAHPADRGREARAEAAAAPALETPPGGHGARAPDAPETLGELLTRYAEVIGPQRARAGAEVARMRINFAEFLEWPLALISAFELERWRAERLRSGTGPARRAKGRPRPVAANTVNRDLAPLRAAFARAVQWGWLEANPLERFQPARVDRRARVRFLDDEEEQRLRAALEAREQQQRAARARHNAWRRARRRRAAPSLDGVPYTDHLRPMVLLSLHTGLRRGELFSLEWRDVSFAREQLTVRGETAKTGTTRHIPLNAEALEVLRAWHAQDRRRRAGLVFVSPRGGRFDNVNKAWGAVLREARITGFRWHDLRHTFASRLVMAGAGIETVRELLGHSTLAMTLRYAHLAPAHKRDAVALLVRPRSPGALEPAP